ncbi:DUF58 domain-containing protein [Geochorda subterranea]|uniref:DUF58 domain-containing protein n=1 Tax=Geochorda subterranea TaxID=3109564 RepID=A0ABZ1BSB3_9FIRM|nr:DUF58 domain-containing protein [Limnochorda sp. LNt]WRP15103.1 DUF58 domain-containing protein [Limnochorda sp. LNt]
MLDERWLTGLGRLRIASHLSASGGAPAWRPVRRAGEGWDFLSHREYMPGDDYRAIDWKALARLDRPYVRVHARESDLLVELALDDSLSMAEPDAGKWAFARQLAACLGVVALTSGERVRLITSSTHASLAAPDARAEPLLRGSHPAALSQLLRALQAVRPGGEVDWGAWAARIVQGAPGPAVTVLISDLLSPVEAVESALQALTLAHRDVVVVHVLSPGEMRPAASGELRLVDVESGQTLAVRLDAPTLARYEALVRDWQGRLAAFARRRRIRYVLVPSEGSAYAAVSVRLREAGVVR